MDNNIKKKLEYLCKNMINNGYINQYNQCLLNIIKKDWSFFKSINNNNLTLLKILSQQIYNKHLWQLLSHNLNAEKILSQSIYKLLITISGSVFLLMVIFFINFKYLNQSIGPIVAWNILVIVFFIYKYYHLNNQYKNQEQLLLLFLSIIHHENTHDFKNLKEYPGIIREYNKGKKIQDIMGSYIFIDNIYNIESFYHGFNFLIMDNYNRYIDEIQILFPWMEQYLLANFILSGLIIMFFNIYSIMNKF